VIERTTRMCQASKWTNRQGFSHCEADAKSLLNRQGFSHREADAKSLLDEAIRRGMGERGRASGDRSARPARSLSIGPRK
jgi:hypothetical protein